MVYMIDLFCGAGGMTTGAMRVPGVQVIACVNHDPKAIKSHEANHPDCKHYIEDIRTLDLSDLKKMVQRIRREEPDAIILLHASLECTNFSNAKGGMPRDADSRTLAEHLIRYIEELEPDYVTIENVREFLAWGPLDENGKPISRDKGIDYLAWRDNVIRHGYNCEHRILNSADYGARTKRKRLFIQFARPSLPIRWPEPTHSDKGKDGLLPWNPVKEVLQLEKHGISIFGRKKNLSTKTYHRIWEGLVKYVAGGKKEFLAKYHGGSPEKSNRTDSMDAPLSTVDTQNRHYIIAPQFISKQFSGHPASKNQGVEEPAPTVKPIDNNMLVSGVYLLNYQHSSDSNSVEEPSPTITTKDKYAYITTYHGNGAGLHGMDAPGPTIPCKDSAALIQPQQFIQRDFTGGGQLNDIDSAAGTITNVPKMHLVTPKQWVMSTNFTNIGAGLNEPANTITANRKHFYLMNPQYMGSGGSIDTPAFTLIARMDKMPPYLVQTESGHCAIAIEEGDCEYMIKIKEFMALYGIIDIMMRMLFIDELKQIQGFPIDYVLEGNQADQKKFIGNAVQVDQAEAFIASITYANFPHYATKAA